MMHAMQSHRNHSHPSHGGRYASMNSGERSGQSDHYQRRYNDNREEDRRRHPDPAAGRHSSRPSSSMSSSRWEPPKRKTSSPDTAATASSSSSSNSGWGRHHQQQQPMMQIERENNCRGSGARGGGKINRQRRQSNDTNNQRNQHRQQQQRPKKTIISPDEPMNINNDDTTNNQKQPTVNNETIPKLNPSDPTHAKRIRQRRRQVLFGKNTAGYEEYTKKVPRSKRRVRSLECPMTPDHTLDIPAKRWQGLMNAWRRSLHKFDPPDLHLRQRAQTTITLAPRPCVTEEDRQEEEIAQAKATGLQVAFGGMNVGREAGLFSVGVAPEEMVANGNFFESDEKTEEVAFDEEAAYQQTMMEGGGGGDAERDGGFLNECESDSDDDVL